MRRAYHIRGETLLLLIGTWVFCFLISNLHSQTLQQLTTSTADDIQPQWSPDGSQLVFASKPQGETYGLWIVNADGTGLRQLVDDLTLDETKPDWVGSNIVFLGSKTKEIHIYIINSDGTGLRQVSHVNNVNAPKLSPDGLKIAFDSAGEFDYTGWHQPWVVNVDSTELTHLKSSGHGMWVVWAQDANHIAYALGSNYDQPHHIYVIEANGTNETTIVSSLPDNTQLAYSPDGTRIAYLSGTPTNRNISVMNWDGSGKVQLTSDPGDEFFANTLYYVLDEIWSPDNYEIVFTSRKNGNSDIFSINVDGTNLSQLTTHTAEDFEAVWSPEGSKIAFVSDRGGNNDIWVLRPAVSTNVSALDFGEINIGGFSDTTVTMTNIGSMTLKVTNIVMSGTNSSEFSLMSNKNFSLPTGQQKEVKIRFQPSSLGNKNASMIIFHNAPGDSNIVNLSGKGVDIEAPTISAVNADPIVNFNTPTYVTAKVSDNVSVQEVRLFYREGGQSSFQTVIMNEVSGSYQGTIPSSIAGTQGVEFTIEAEDASNNLRTTKLRAVRVRLPDKHLSRSHQGGTAQQAYRLISFPLESDDPSVAATLLDDLGPADSLQWRLWDIDPQRSDSLFPYREYPFVSDMAAGKSKFLITRETVTLTSGAGVTVNTVAAFEISLTPGWNMIASPFNFDIPIDNVEPESLRAHLYTYNGSWTSFPNFLSPWQGYLIKVNEPVTLTINASQATTTPQSAIQKLVVSAVEPPAIAADWYIQIQGSCEQAWDSFNMVGVVQDAAMEWDRYERFEPPPIGEFVMVSFPHRDWARYPDVHTTDFRLPSSDGHMWELSVDTNIPNRLVTLRFENLQSVPPDVEIQLIDVDLRITQNMRKNSKYMYRSNRSGGTKKFRLLVGKSKFVKENSAEFIAIPSSIELAQNFPNPFNPSTSIKFGLPRKNRVSLKIYNILGQEVATLLHGFEKEAGYGVAIWDGKDQTGRTVPSGIYIYRLQMGQRVLTKKMTLLK